MIDHRPHESILWAIQPAQAKLLLRLLYVDRKEVRLNEPEDVLRGRFSLDRRDSEHVTDGMD
jgi:hypothetical protein